MSPHAAICQVSEFSEIGVQVSGVSLCAAQLVDASETAVQTSDVSGMLVHVSGVSDSGVHFRVADTLMPEESAIEIALCCILFVNTATLDTAVTVIGALTVTVVPTVVEL